MIRPSAEMEIESPVTPLAFQSPAEIVFVATGFTARSFVSLFRVSVWLEQWPEALPPTKSSRSLPLTYPVFAVGVIAIIAMIND